MSISGAKHIYTYTYMLSIRFRSQANKRIWETQQKRMWHCPAFTLNVKAFCNSDPLYFSFSFPFQADFVACCLLSHLKIPSLDGSCTEGRCGLRVIIADNFITVGLLLFSREFEHICWWKYQLRHPKHFTSCNKYTTIPKSKTPNMP